MKQIILFILLALAGSSCNTFRETGYWVDFTDSGMVWHPTDPYEQTPIQPDAIAMGISLEEKLMDSNTETIIKITLRNKTQDTLYLSEPVCLAAVQIYLYDSLYNLLPAIKVRLNKDCIQPLKLAPAEVRTFDHHYRLEHIYSSFKHRGRYLTCTYTPPIYNQHGDTILKECTGRIRYPHVKKCNWLNSDTIVVNVQ